MRERDARIAELEEQIEKGKELDAKNRRIAALEEALGKEKGKGEKGKGEKGKGNARTALY